MLTYELPVDEQTNDIHDNWIAEVHYEPKTQSIHKITNLFTKEDMIAFYRARGKQYLEAAIEGFIEQIEQIEEGNDNVLQ